MKTSYLQLGNLLNTTISDPLDPSMDAVAPSEGEHMDTTALVRQALERRLDVISGRAHARSLEAASLESILHLFPSIGLDGQYRVTNEPGLSGRSSTWFIGVTASWLLFDAGARFADHAEETALARIADLSLQALERKVDVDVRTALVELENQKASFKQARVAKEAAVKNAGEVSELYRQGLASALQAADANVSQFEATVTMIREEYGLAIANLNLRAAMGLDPLGKEFSR